MSNDLIMIYNQRYLCWHDCTATSNVLLVSGRLRPPEDCLRSRRKAKSRREHIFDVKISTITGESNKMSARAEFVPDRMPQRVILEHQMIVKICCFSAKPCEPSSTDLPLRRWILSRKLQNCVSLRGTRHAARITLLPGTSR